MRKLFSYILLLTLSFSSIKAEIKEDISKPDRQEILFVKDLTTANPKKGKVQIFQDPRMLILMEEKASENKNTNNQNCVIQNGYRVQVYSSNTPQKSKTEAFNIEADIKLKYPEKGVYVSFSSPFWKVRVGDFNTYQEAFSFVEILKTEFPTIRNSIYIIKENIRISIK